MPTVQGSEVWWQESGDGPPLLLVQGLGYSADAWWRLVPDLSARFRVLVFDNRGVGRTPVPQGPISIESMADDAAAVLDDADVESAHVFGASMGGLVAQELALRHPQRVRSLVLGCTSPGGGDAVASQAAAQGFLQSRAEMSAREAAEASVPLVYADTTPRELVDQDIDVRMRRPTTAAGYAAQLAAVLAYGGALDRLPGLGLPTLVLHGTQDRLVPPENAPLLAGAIPGARLEWLEGAGHVFTTDAAPRTIELLTGWLTDAEQARTGPGSVDDRSSLAGAADDG